MKIELREIVELFINSGSEGDNWDFKKKWHSNNADLLKDIICMANNTTSDMQDGYIIFGIENETLHIVGVSEDDDRKTQGSIVTFIQSKPWAGEEIPDIDVETIFIDGKEIDVLIIRNSESTPYYILQDYSKPSAAGKDKTIVRAGVVYSRVRDRNTSSSECATKHAAEFLWKKRFGLVGSDDLKVIKRLQNVNSWYSPDDLDTIYNSEYDDIKIIRKKGFSSNVELNAGVSNTAVWVMDFPYLFTTHLNWNIGQKETGRREQWDININGRKLDFSLFGVQGTRQDYYHIEPPTYYIKLNNLHPRFMGSLPYHAYLENSVELLAYELFFHLQCYHENQKALNNAFTVIPIFKNQQEHVNFTKYLSMHNSEFSSAVEEMNIDEMFPTYAKDVDTAVVYKLGKTMVLWLEQWRQYPF